ncbi:amidase [Stakelama sp. CBK3Z-3]|uniref:Amidase n=1 Tax=Stakelama flava TaxID=2860338 RepID=A0ABS6XNF6_9SPHN|nr:amidase [Stakelama flava]MBW4331747.1 amidase [Stakelama flava]
MTIRFALAALALGFSVQSGAQAHAAAPRDVALPKVAERSLADLSAALTSGEVTSEQLVRAYLARINAMDRKGPALRSVIAVNPQALADAKRSDAERKAGRVRGPLHGVPIVIKDNIELAGPLPTTAGSLALKDNVTNRDAPVVARLKAAGAIILAKTNLSEWANIRSIHAMSGWSAVGGLVKNPYALDRTACGSSSGTGAAVAASFAAAGLGTETDGSVTCPSSMNGLVGLKPTIGLVSRTHIVPISHSQDTAGPMARSVRDAALLFTAMVGSDPGDPTTKDADAHRMDYASGLSKDALKGVRIAVLHPDAPDALMTRFHEQLKLLEAAGATLVEVKAPDTKGMGDAEFQVLMMELKSDMAAYLANTPAAVKAKTLADLIAFDNAHEAAEMPYFGQEIFEMADKTGGIDDPAYADARTRSKRLATNAIDTMLKQANATILVEPTYGMPWLSDTVYGDQFSGPSAADLPAISGYPHLTVPMGLVKGLPVGLSFIGPKYSEAKLFAAGYAYEQATKARVAPGYKSTLKEGTGVEGAGE